MPVLTFVVAFIQPVLKGPSSVLLLSFEPPCFPSKASISVALSIMLKRVGALKHPCFNPFETEITLDISPFYMILVFIPSWNWSMIKMNLPGHPIVFIVVHRPSRQIVLKAFDTSTNVNSRLLFCSWDFFCTCLAAKIRSTVSRLTRTL